MRRSRNNNVGNSVGQSNVEPFDASSTSSGAVASQAGEMAGAVQARPWTFYLAENAPASQFQPIEYKIAFNLNPGFLELAPLQPGRRNRVG